MKISKKVLNTEFAGNPQSVKVLSEDTACGDGLLTIAQSSSLSGFHGFFEDYKSVFLVGKMYILIELSLGCKILFADNHKYES